MVRRGCAWLLACAVACTHVPEELGGLPCDEGRCLPGWACHPERGLCVPALSIDCDRAGAACPQRTATGDLCAEPGLFMPCAEDAVDCGPGCRTCGEDGRWGACSESTCVPGRTWSCASCDDDCAGRVQHARAICELTAGAFRCDYDGGCRDGAVDADGVRDNGCECLVSGGGVELCDARDNDCDGQVDEELGIGGSCGIGACAGGVYECGVAQAGRQCSTMAFGSDDRTSPEVCDGVDNDCDREIDEGPGFECPLGAVELCSPSTSLAYRQCAGCTWGACVSAPGRRLAIVVRGVATVEALAEVPVLVEVDATLVTYSAMAAGGADVRFYDAQSGRRLPHEVEHFDTTGTSSFWVRVPSVDPQLGRTIYMVYATSAVPLPADSADVWGEDYLGVWHLQQAAPGGNNPGIYFDSRGTAHGDDRVTNAPIVGAAGRAVSFARGDLVDVGTRSALELRPPFTVEVWVEPDPLSFIQAHSLAVSPATQSAGQLVELRLATPSFDYRYAGSGGEDLRVVAQGVTLPLWIEQWNPSGVSVLWVKVPSAGVSSLELYSGHRFLAAVSDHTAVLSPGAWLTQWSTSHVTPQSFQDMEALFRGASYDARANWGVVNEVNCSGSGTSCIWSGVGADRFLTLAEGWIQRPAGVSTRTFGVSGDDAIDVVMGGLAWKSDTGGALVAQHYGLHGVEDPWLHTGSFTWTRPLERFSVRHEEQTGTQGYRLWWAPDAWEAVPQAALWHRPRTLGAQPAASVSQLRQLGRSISKTARLEMSAAGGRVRWRVDGVELEAELANRWTYVALVHDGAALRLFIDGEMVVEREATPPSGAFGGALVFGDLDGDLVSRVPHLDEVRISRGARSASWITLQRRAMDGALTTYGVEETVP